MATAGSPGSVRFAVRIALLGVILAWAATHSGAQGYFPPGAVVLSSTADCASLSRILSTRAVDKTIQSWLATGPVYAEFGGVGSSRRLVQYESRLGLTPPGMPGLILHAQYSPGPGGIASTAPAGVSSWLEFGVLLPAGLFIEDSLSLELLREILANPPQVVAGPLATGYWISSVRATHPPGSPPEVRTLTVEYASASAASLTVSLSALWDGIAFTPGQQW